MLSAILKALAYLYCAFALLSLLLCGLYPVLMWWEGRCTARGKAGRLESIIGKEQS